MSIQYISISSQYNTIQISIVIQHTHFIPNTSFQYIFYSAPHPFNIYYNNLSFLCFISIQFWFYFTSISTHFNINTISGGNTLVQYHFLPISVQYHWIPMIHFNIISFHFKINIVLILSQFHINYNFKNILIQNVSVH